MLDIAATGEWHSGHPGGIVGLLELAGARNADPLCALEGIKRETEARLRARYAGYQRQDLLALPIMAAYDRYYTRFSKTYHVQLQVESIVLKGKNLPQVSPLVDANFSSEVDSFVLTAGHDVARLRQPISIDSSRQGDSMTLMNGTTREIYPGDMIMRDAGGIACSIIYGQDNRSPISVDTTAVLYVAYSPAAVPGELVQAHLHRIEESVRLFSPDVVVEQLVLLKAGDR
jgi:DNA/RNA-binding domain of Phe-tRNA-synthetase-like protein